jgi:5-carboxymethyl-2-hydroxymuconate isomerase
MLSAHQKQQLEEEAFKHGWWIRSARVRMAAYAAAADRLDYSAVIDGMQLEIGRKDAEHKEAITKLLRDITTA